MGKTKRMVEDINENVEIVEAPKGQIVPGVFLEQQLFDTLLGYLGNRPVVEVQTLYAAVSNAPKLEVAVSYENNQPASNS